MTQSIYRVLLLLFVYFNSSYSQSFEDIHRILINRISKNSYNFSSCEFQTEYTLDQNGSSFFFDIDFSGSQKNRNCLVYLNSVISHADQNSEFAIKSIELLNDVFVSSESKVSFELFQNLQNNPYVISLVHQSFSHVNDQVVTLREIAEKDLQFSGCSMKNKNLNLSLFLNTNLQKNYMSPQQLKLNLVWRPCKKI